LHMLLLDVFPHRGWRRPRRISATAAACARGIGPMAVGEIVVGAWDLRNEGRPIDLDVVDGVRLVVLGPPSREWSWNACRRFDGLPASLQVDGQLTRSQVEQWAARSAG